MVKRAAHLMPDEEERLERIARDLNATIVETKPVADLPDERYPNGHRQVLAERIPELNDFDRNEATCDNCGGALVRAERHEDEHKSNYSTWCHVDKQRLFDCPRPFPREEVA